MGLGVGACEALFIAQEGVEIILTLDSAKEIVCRHKKRDSSLLPLQGSEFVEPVVKLKRVHVLCDWRQVLDCIFQHQVPSFFL